MTAPGQVTTNAKPEATQVLETAQDQANNVKDTALGAATDVVDTAKEQVGNVLGETVDQAKDLASQMKEQAARQLDSQSSKAIDQARGLSQQLTSGDTSGMVGQILSEAGHRLQALTDYVDRVGPQGVLEDARRYARRNPGTFILGTALAGLVSGRVMKGIKASQPSTPMTQPEPLAATPSSTYVAPPSPDTAYPSDPTLLQETRYGGSL